jgi:RimJ/RimL family protein N-acetyltransferase
METGFVVETARLRLREFAASDAMSLQSMHREPRVRELLVDDYPLDQAAVACHFIERLQVIYRDEPGLGIWHAQRLEAADPSAEREARAAVDAGELSPEVSSFMLRPRWHFCGWFNLMRMPDDPSRVEIGCRLRPEAWGTGLALEGGEALLRHAFGRLRLSAVWGICHPRHHAVRAVLRALGFVDRGVQLYDAQPAAHFSIDRAQSEVALATPLRERVRNAVRAERAAAPAEAFAA